MLFMSYPFQNALLQLSENVRGANIFMTLLLERGYQFTNQATRRRLHVSS